MPLVTDIWRNVTSVCIAAGFVTQLCPGTVGPTYGEVLRFDPNSKSDVYVTPLTTVDCWITLRGRPTEAGMPQYYTTLTWRAAKFSIRGYGYKTSMGTAACVNGYVEVYRATNDGRPISPPAVRPVCGTTAMSSFTSTSQTIVVHLYVEAPPPTTTTSTTTTIPTTAVTQETTVNTTANTTETSVAATTVTVPTTTIPPDLGPFINFTADFTSYFIGEYGLQSMIKC